jgi:hypothetical protein
MREDLLAPLPKCSAPHETIQNTALPRKNALQVTSSLAMRRHLRRRFGAILPDGRAIRYTALRRRIGHMKESGP